MKLRACAVGLALLHACGGDPPTGGDAGTAGPTDAGPISADVPAAPDATPAAPDAAPEDAFVPEPLAWAPCADSPDAGFTCAMLTVPVDPERPSSSARARLHLQRSSATVPAERMGVLVINPGGPGVAGGPVVPRVAETFPRLRERFDIIGFDWRGTGKSEPALACATSAERDERRALDPHVDLAGYRAWHDRMASTCRAQVGDEFAAHVGTVDTVTDIEILRRALGEDKLNYLGVSYGTRLGAAYAARFPERVRAFVLDSVVPPDWAFEARGIDNDYEAAISRFATACFDRPMNCSFHSAESPDAIVAAWDALADRLTATPLVTRDGRTFRATDLRSMTITLLRGGNYFELAPLLSELERGDASTALALADALEGLAPDGSYEHSVEPNVAILCADQFGPGKTSAASFDAFLAQQASTRFGPTLYGDYSPCPSWPGLRAAPPLAAPGAPPLYLVNATGDPATPPRSAEATQAALANDSHLDLFDFDAHSIFERQGPKQRIENFILKPENKPGPYSCAGTPDPLTLPMPTESVRFSGRIVRQSVPFRTSTAAITLEIVSRDDDRVLTSTVVTNATGTFETDLVPTQGRPLSIYVRASAPGYVSQEVYYRSPRFSGGIGNVLLPDVSVFSTLFGSNAPRYDPRLGVVRFVLQDCELQKIGGATITSDAPSGSIRYVNQTSNGCTFSSRNTMTDGVCDSYGYNFPAGDHLFTVRAGADEIRTRVRVRAGGYTWVEIRP